MAVVVLVALGGGEEVGMEVVVQQCDWTILFEGSHARLCHARSLLDRAVPEIAVVDSCFLNVRAEILAVVVVLCRTALTHTIHAHGRRGFALDAPARSVLLAPLPPQAAAQVL